MRYLLVANPAAQSGAAKKRIEHTLERMRERGLDVDFLATEPEGRTVEKVRQAIDADGCDVVVALGGDGTFAEVAKGLVAARRAVRMGMLPSGTANDQGKSFGISNRASRLDENLDILEEGHLCHLDVGRIERLDDAGGVTHQDLFFDSAGFGMHPTILLSRNRDRKRVEKVPLVNLVYRDQAVYAGAMLERYLRSWLEPVKFDAEVTSGGAVHRYRGLTDLVVNATPVYGGIWVPSRDSVPDDGLFELVALHGRREMFSRMLVDHKDFPLDVEDVAFLGFRHTECFSAAAFEIVLLQPRGGEVASQIDGEEWAAGNHFRVQVIPNRIPLVVRPDFVPPWGSGHGA